MKKPFDNNSIEIRIELAAYLLKLRLGLNLTQNQVAIESGLSQSAISRIENGKEAASLFNLVRVYRVLSQWESV
ncbi:MAG: helix-turn-helix transcriptional regulator [Chlorobium sp.]|jgi:transcriptional regulator with XRE-family HTH domain|nr:helix-turn-helix transcriptional regulator [Chlorobium sp.]